MSAESNKDVVLRLCQHLNDRDLTRLVDLLHDGATWGAPFRPDLFAFGGVRTKSELPELFGGFLLPMEHFSFSVTSITAEDDRVVVEAEGHGIGPGGARYDNTYAIVFVLRDGKVETVRERFDPYAVLDYAAQLPVA